VQNPHDSVALQRAVNTPPRGIGKTTLETLERIALETGVSTWDGDWVERFGQAASGAGGAGAGGVSADDSGCAGADAAPGGFCREAGGGSGWRRAADSASGAAAETRILGLGRIFASILGLRRRSRGDGF
jgi:hypothetical protein